MKPIKPIWSVGIIFLIFFFFFTSFVYASPFKGPWDQDSSSVKLQSCHCEERSDVAIYPTEIASHSFAMTSINSSRLNSAWHKKINHKKIDHRFNPMRFMVEVYRNYISPIDGKDCPMYPSCSGYSLQCFKKHGFFIGWMMTCDRLYRCGRDELRLSPKIIVNGEIRCNDPIENNDFWWYHGR